MLKDRFLIVGQGKDGAEGVKLHHELKPDVVLLDITMPNLGGKECLEAILKENPNTIVIMVSSLGDEQTVKDCINLGAKMFVNKDTIRSGPLSANPVLGQALSVALGESFLEAA